MQECSFIDFELDTSLFSLADRFCKIESNRASLGAGHQASRPKLFTKSSYFTHYIGCCDRDIKTDPVSFDLFHQVIQTNKVCASCFRFIGFLALREYQHLHIFTSSGGEHSYTTHHLIRVSRINAKLHMNFDCWIKFHIIHFFEEWNCFLGLVELAWLDKFLCLQIFLSVFRHILYTPSLWQNNRSDLREAFNC